MPRASEEAPGASEKPVSGQTVQAPGVGGGVGAEKEALVSSGKVSPASHRKRARERGYEDAFAGTRRSEVLFPSLEPSVSVGVVMFIKL